MRVTCLHPSIQTKDVNGYKVITDELYSTLKEYKELGYNVVLKDGYTLKADSIILSEISDSDAGVLDKLFLSSAGCYSAVFEYMSQVDKQEEK